MNVEKSEPGGFILAHMLIHSNPLLSTVYRAPSLQGAGPGYSRAEPSGAGPGWAELNQAEQSRAEQSRAEQPVQPAYSLQASAAGMWASGPLYFP